MAAIWPRPIRGHEAETGTVRFIEAIHGWIKSLNNQIIDLFRKML